MRFGSRVRRLTNLVNCRYLRLPVSLTTIEAFACSECFPTLSGVRARSSFQVVRQPAASPFMMLRLASMSR